MPEGALLSTTIEAVLHDLASSAATGCLVVRDQEGDEAEVYLRDGAVYAVTVPGRRVMLGVRLMSRGALTPEALSEALEIQRTELQGWRLGELLVHLGYVELSVVEEFVVEHLKDALADLMGWPMSAWKFRKAKKTRQDVAPPMAVSQLLDELRERAMTWAEILDSIGGPEAVPGLSSGPASDSVALGPNEWALLCKVDAERTIAELAGDCGFTLFEAGQVVTRLIEAGLVSIEDQGAGAEAEAEIAEAEADRPPVGLVALEDDSSDDEHDVADVEPQDEVGSELILPVVPLAEMQAREAAEDAEAKRLREAETVHRQLEALAAAETAARAARTEARRQAAAEAEELARREQAEREAAELAAAEEVAWADHARWLTDRAAAELAEAEAAAWVDHRDWLDAQRAAAEELAWADHEHWLAVRAAAEAERARREEAERQAQAAAAERERAAREEAERQAQAAAAERERAAREQHAAREQAERELQAEAERRARAAREAAEEQAAREVQAEAEMIARDEAERQARLAAERDAIVAADEAAQHAAEQQARDDEAFMGAEIAAQAASMLTELTRDLPQQPESVQPPLPAPVQETRPPAVADSGATDVHREEQGHQPAPIVDRDSTDTAMLLRELSSLGFGDNDGPAPPVTPPPSRPTFPQNAVDPKKKRKGLFGRG